MNRTIRYVLGAAVAYVFWVGGIHAQDLLVPAGTLLQCTLSEPNFSSATASVGDPVLCHLKSLQEFGRTVFPRGSMLAGHLEAEKEPGHFIGKGYLEIRFDRVILPSGDLPVPAKVIQAKGFNVDFEGRGTAGTPTDGGHFHSKGTRLWASEAGRIAIRVVGPSEQFDWE